MDRLDCAAKPPTVADEGAAPLASGLLAEMTIHIVIELRDLDYR